jgi:hypothetical protein
LLIRKALDDATKAINLAKTILTRELKLTARPRRNFSFEVLCG